MKHLLVSQTLCVRETKREKERESEFVRDDKYVATFELICKETG